MQPPHRHHGGHARAGGWVLRQVVQRGDVRAAEQAHHASMAKIAVLIVVGPQHFDQRRDGFLPAEFAEGNSGKKTRSRARIGQEFEQAGKGFGGAAVAEDFGGLGARLGVGTGEQRQERGLGLGIGRLHRWRRVAEMGAQDGHLAAAERQSAGQEVIVVMQPTGQPAAAKRAAIPADRALEFFIPQEQRACDDAGLELKQHHGARLRVQPRRWVSKPPVAGREVAEKATLLHLLDAFV